MLHGHWSWDILLATWWPFRTLAGGPAVSTTGGAVMACVLTTAGVTMTAMAMAPVTTQRGDVNALMIIGGHTVRWRQFRVRDVENTAAAVAQCLVILVTAPTATLVPTVKLTLVVDVVFTDHVTRAQQTVCVLMATPAYTATLLLTLTASVI